jgi:hypothetical protein
MIQKGIYRKGYRQGFTRIQQNRKCNEEKKKQSMEDQEEVEWVQKEK